MYKNKKNKQEIIKLSKKELYIFLNVYKICLNVYVN